MVKRAIHAYLSSGHGLPPPEKYIPMQLRRLSHSLVFVTFLILSIGQLRSAPVTETNNSPQQKAISIELPDSTLGRIMREWFAVINSGKPAEIKRFVATRFSTNAFRFQQSAEQYEKLFQKLHQQSGGLEIVHVTPESGGQPISILAKSKRGEHFAQITAGLDNSGKLAGLGIDKSESPDTPKLSNVSKALSEKEMIKTIEKDLRRRADAGDFSGVILIAKDDKILLQRAYGFADREAKIRNTLETRFHLASVDKMFTATAIAQLVKAGKLSYTDTIEKVLPDYPNKDVAQKVTIHQLLTHSAGFGTFFESPGFVKGKMYRNSTEEIAVYKDEKLFFEPGTRWRYSNAGFSLLGAIVEHVSGKTYLDYIRENILKPLSMEHTDLTDSSDNSVFYTQSPEDPLGLDPFLADRTLNQSPPTGFGGGFATADDMFKFLRAYRTGRLLGPDAIQTMVDSKVNQDSRRTRRYGHGISEYDSNGGIVRGHRGGSRTDVEMLWNSGYTVIAMVNAIPPPVDATSNDIVSFITKQESLRQKK